MPENEPALVSDDFRYYDEMDFTEKITRYIPGGYHPAILGMILGEPPQRQYRLMHKLGWGSYATVWLAQATDEPSKLVAVKITTADADEDTQMREVEMLQEAAKIQPDDQSYSHIIKLLDHFKLHGPNGTHTVIVTEVVIPIFSFPRQPPAWRKAAAYGVAQAMAQLHASQIVHGDWHLGNVGLAIPQFANQDPQEVMRNLKTPDISFVLTNDAAKQTASLPAYLTIPCSMASYHQQVAGADPPQLKIFDFGSAHKFGTHPRRFQCAINACAPEVVLARVIENIDNPAIDQRADVWALGSAIYEIITGGFLFHNVGMKALPYRMSELALGRIPSHWESWSASLSGRKPITQESIEKRWAGRWITLRKGCETDEDANALVRLLKTVFVLDPAERPTAAQVVNDPWFQSVSGAKADASAQT